MWISVFWVWRISSGQEYLEIEKGRKMRCFFLLLLHYICQNQFQVHLRTCSSLPHLRSYFYNSNNNQCAGPRSIWSTSIYVLGKHESGALYRQPPEYLQSTSVTMIWVLVLVFSPYNWLLYPATSQYFPPSTVKANRSSTYFPAVIGGYLLGFPSLTQLGNVSTVSS